MEENLELKQNQEALCRLIQYGAKVSSFDHQSTEIPTNVSVTQEKKFMKLASTFGMPRSL